jgi:hypothetical protein
MTDSDSSAPSQDADAVTVSVALCTFNGEKFLKPQLESILAQTFAPEEIIISDDGSTDQTLSIIADFVGRSAAGDISARITLLDPAPRSGVAANFQRAIQACSGSLIALSDQDDLWRDDKLARLVSYLNIHPSCMLVHSDARLVDRNGASLGHTLLTALGVSPRDKRLIQSGDALTVLLRRNVVTGATVLFRRELLAWAVPIPAGWIHDEWLAMTAAVSGGVGLLDEPLVDYRQHGSNEIGAQKLTLRILLTRFFGSRSDRNQRLLLRSQSLCNRAISEMPIVPMRTMTLFIDKRDHELVRSALSSSRVKRIVPLLREVATGRYGAFGNGLGDALRDGLQSAS